MIQTMVALFGLIFGSFLNVCIVRVPRSESIIVPGSHCPACGRSIRWYDNIPLLSYALLRGRCRDCNQRISLLYPLVEILTAAVFLLEYWRYGLSVEFGKGLIFAMLMIVLIFTDLRERRIPHKISVPGIALGVAFSLIAPVDNRPFGWLLARWDIFPSGLLLSLLGSLAGALIGGGLFFVVGEIFYRLRHKEGLGFGDVMLMLVVGAFLGPPLTLMTILLGSLLGSLVAIPVTVINPKFRSYQWPYGTFLGVAAIYASIGGDALLRAYLQWGGFR
ncbi:MAG: prepilin peptidase [Acidobacteria bacterium]|nr:MAG: prepilin peptidase [Acidobacteriota bacterium]